MNLSFTIRTSRIMWRLLNEIRSARIKKNTRRAAHLKQRYERLEAKGWRAIF